ncbi:MAG: hypothetical protein RMJ98_16530, partial [Myxococcales bacterium]|nr:hypothetical protein [Polyangiaceae bacterium]MDW8250902.1 hypothetical protein [Myxococcales bacterium]
MERYEEARFRRNIDAALQSIRTILDHTKNPCYPEDVPHRYEDKFLLAEFLTRTATVAVLQGLGALGLSSEGLAKLLAWSRIHPVTLRFTAEERCKFLREETRQEESTQQHTIEKRSLQGGNTTTTAKIITTVKEYFWSFEFSYELVAYQGNHLETQVLRRRSGQLELRTSARTAPRPESVIRPPLDVNLSWLLGQIDGEQRASFSIDRTDPACHTPRRNPPVESALEALRALASWCSLVHSYFLRDLFPVHTEHSLDLSAISAEGVFVPVVPVFEMTHEAVGERSAAYAGSFLEEQQRSLTNRFAQIAKIFPQEGLITSADAALLVTLLHLIEVAQHHADGVDYIEAMLRNQLIAAIGKELTPADFSAYMNFHQRKLFRPEHRPLPFSVTIRRPEHSPEGVLSIEATQGGITAPICTSCARSEARSPMYFPLDAATRVPFLGERYLHGWIAYQFSGQQSLTLNLVARARQFSSFLLLVGRIASADTFEPRHGIILQNKDLLKIPLLLEPIPTPKEFRDAKTSLKTEQKQKARAIRAMKLESKHFSVCIGQKKTKH